MKRKKRIPLTTVIVLLVILCVKLGQDLGSKELDTTSPNTVATHSDYGNLLDVVTSSGEKEQTIHYKGMDISFNPEKHIPNWVAWELTADETQGDIKRTNKFASDPNVAGCGETWDYAYSGYDRGHMAPAGDMKWDREAMDETFLLTNICPQSKALNTGSWRTLEEKCRQWARRDSILYIVCGPVPSDEPIEYIGETRIWVPQAYYKVILSPYSTPARGIGFIMPNRKFSGGMQVCAVSIDSVESLTGHDFFHTLPDSLENILEKQCNFPQWSNLKNDRKK